VLFYVWNALATLVFFSYEQLRKTIWPMLTMFKHVQLPFIERFETIIIALWIVHVVCTSSGYLWAGMRGVEKTVPIRKSWGYAGIFVTTFVFGTAIEGRVELNFYLNWLSKVGLGVMVGYPLLLWLIALVLRKKGGQPHEQTGVEAPASADSGRQHA
jgi:spore germination protein AB